MAPEVKKEIELEIAHVLFIDIVGYSKFVTAEQRRLLELLNRIVRGTEQFRSAEAAGRLIKIPTGDGMALVFYKSPEEPIECALEISRAIKDHPQLRLRMGVHSGAVSRVVDVNERANVAGAGINLAQRVMDCGDTGHILLSRHVAEDLEQFEHWQPHLHDLGECEVKHGVRVSAFNFYTEELGNPELPEKFRQTEQTQAALSAIPEKSIAVLPFENLSSDKENAYFADGIQDEILTRLAKIADLKVISRTSTQHYRSAPENLPEIARQLGVAHILEGRVQKSADSVRVNVQLIKATNDSHLWADTFDRKLTDIFSVESEVAKAIADQLEAKLTGHEEQVIGSKPTDNVEAYDAYLRGLAYNLQPVLPLPRLLVAQKHFREAVRLDPKFALAWALLSELDARGYSTQLLQPTDALREETRQAAETALTLQPNLGEAVMAKGYYHYACLRDYDTAEHYFEQARQLLPNTSQIPESLAYVARRRGQWDRAESFFNEVERLDPLNVRALAEQCVFYACLRRFPEALRKAEQILNITPDDVNIVIGKAAVAQAQGDLPRASALLAPLRPGPDLTPHLETQIYQAILERHPAPVIPRLKEILGEPDPALGYINGELRFWLGWAQDVAGDHAGAQESWLQARSELENFLKDQPENYFLVGDLALTNAGLGEKTAALALSERAVTALPIEKDALAGPRPLEILARVAAQAGEPGRAIAALQKVLSVPGFGALPVRIPLTPALLRLDPMFDPLRDDPRFQKLCEEKKP